MARQIKVGETSSARRRVYFDLRDSADGITPETGEAGQQPQISTNGGAWTNTGIGVLAHIGSGRYYAELTTAALAAIGDRILIRYKSANTAETPSEDVEVVDFDPARLPEAVDTKLKSTHGDGLWTNPGISGTVLSPNDPAITKDLDLKANYRFELNLDAEGWDASSWTKYVFTIKSDADADDDDNALVMVRETNPGDGTDGLLVHKGRPASDATLGSLTVDTSVANHTAVNIVIAAGAMNLQPSGSKKYAWEVTEYKGTEKRIFADGKLTLRQSVRRKSTAP